MSESIIMINKPDGDEVKVPLANIETMKNRGYYAKEIIPEINEVKQNEGLENGES